MQLLTSIIARGFPTSFITFEISCTGPLCFIVVTPILMRILSRLLEVQSKITKMLRALITAAAHTNSFFGSITKYAAAWVTGFFWLDRLQILFPDTCAETYSVKTCKIYYTGTPILRNELWSGRVRGRERVATEQSVPVLGSDSLKVTRT